MIGNANGIYAKIIADSRDQTRLTTMEIQCHRFVLAEFNTHRVFSRNSASSRAIPLAKQIERVKTNPAVPLSFPAEQKGMQGGAELSEKDRYAAALLWLEGRDAAVEYATKLGELGVHKSIANRVLEPYMWHKIIVSSTEWKNFFDQRCSPLAQPEIRAVAECMLKALNESMPVTPYKGWHLPYVLEEEKNLPLGDLCKISAARCARVSYLTQDGRRDPNVDIGLYDRLVSAKPPHWSPLEHVATPMRSGETPANFYGWTQLRYIEEKYNDYRRH